MSKSKFKKRNKNLYGGANAAAAADGGAADGGGAAGDANSNLSMEINAENDNQENNNNVEVNQQNNGDTDAVAKKEGDGEGTSFVSTFKIVFLVFYIFTKYPLKYTILFALFYAMLTIAKQTYMFGCKAATYFIKFFSVIVDPGEFDLIVFQLPNIFAIFLAFLDLFIGFIYLCITIFFLIILGCIALPFNLIFSL